MGASDVKKTREPVEWLKNAKLEVAPETFTVLSLSHEDWLKALERPELSPRMTVPFLIFKDKWEVTMILEESDFRLIKEFVEGQPSKGNFRLLSFDAEADFEAVGFNHLVTSILGEAGISIVPFASYSRFHIFVMQTDLASALKALRGHVAEIC